MDEENASKIPSHPSDISMSAEDKIPNASKFLFSMIKMGPTFNVFSGNGSSTKKRPSVCVFALYW